MKACLLSLVAACALEPSALPRPPSISAAFDSGNVEVVDVGPRRVGLHRHHRVRAGHRGLDAPDVVEVTDRDVRARGTQRPDVTVPRRIGVDLRPVGAQGTDEGQAELGVGGQDEDRHGASLGAVRPQAVARTSRIAAPDDAPSRRSTSPHSGFVSSANRVARKRRSRSASAAASRSGS